MINVIFWILVVGFGSIPFDRLSDWVFRQLQAISKKVDRPTTTLHMSKAPFVAFSSGLLTFLKGFLVVRFALGVLDNELILLAGLSVLVLVHTWSFWDGFKPSTNYLLLLCGIYTGVNFWVGMSFPILFAIGAFAFNSGLIGIILAVISMFFSIWIYGELPILLPANFIIFGVILIGLKSKIADHMDFGTHSLSTQFEKRNKPRK